MEIDLIYKEPVEVLEDGRSYWYWRSGGYMEFDGYASYGRCGTKKDAEAIITKYFNSKQLF